MRIHTLLAAVLALGVPSAIADPLPTVKVADPVVQLSITLPDGGTGHCSGAWAHTSFGDKIVTAAHCAADLKEGGHIAAQDSLGRLYPVYTVYYDSLHDMAVMSALSARPASQALKLACNAAPQIGDEVSLTGYPLNFGRVTVSGKIAGLASPWALWPTVYRVEMFAAPGDSGGAVVNATGDEIGILVGADPHWPGLSAVEPITTLCSPGLV